MKLRLVTAIIVVFAGPAQAENFECSFECKAGGGAAIVVDAKSPLLAAEKASRSIEARDLCPATQGSVPVPASFSAARADFELIESLGIPKEARS
jgi:hypothetical protein